MPIYDKTPPPSTVGNHNTAEIDYHTSEAAKVKRTREQAYFNSYDFDAIEVLPYDSEENNDDVGVQGMPNQRERDRRQLKSVQTRQQQNKIVQQLTAHQHQNHRHRHQQQQQQQPQQIANHNFKAVGTECNSFLADNHNHLHHSRHTVNNKYNPTLYLQYISKIFASKTNNSNKPQAEQSLHQEEQQHNGAGCVSGIGSKDIAVAINAFSHNDTHSSSETSSTSLSSSSIVQQILNVENVVGVGNDVTTTGNALVLPMNCARDITGTDTHTNVTKTINVEPIGMVASTSATTIDSVTSTKVAGSGSNFLLPRAMLKYQSSTLNTQQGATDIKAGITNSIPLATKASNNTSANTNKQQQQQQQQIKLTTIIDGHKLNDNKRNNAMKSTVGSNTGLRLKKTSSSSSIVTSLASEDIEEERGIEDNRNECGGKLKVQDKGVTKSSGPKGSARASPHQSHYSTDKSASSGYYSSNVCSTYSLEEHIYSEPTLDIKKLRNNAKENELPPPSLPLSSVAAVATASRATASAVTTFQINKKLQQHQQLSNNLLTTSNEAHSVIRSLDINGRYRLMENEPKTLTSTRKSQEFNENLKILESSIENLDRHLKSFPAINSQETLVNFNQIPFSPYASVNPNDKLRSSASYHQLPTIQESFDTINKQSWLEDRSDDSLMDIDLDSFLLDKDKKVGHKSKEALNSKGLDNPTFLTEEQEENHYKCAKYINSCPEDAYRVESDIIAPAHSSISDQSVAVSMDLYPKRYEEQLHFQNTRELLEDVRDKIRLLTQTQDAKSHQVQASNAKDQNEYIPKELHNMINTLKQELESYLDRMNQHSELEIRQLCTGLVKNQHIVKMKNAFERRRSLTETPDLYSTYEAVQDGIVMSAQGVPISIRQQITSIRCSSDPNFKMKRKSITEVFPLVECYVEAPNPATQLQKNLSYHKPVLEQFNTSNTNANLKGNNTSTTPGSGTASGGDTSEPNDKESILDWHRKKPSIWEMYYGTNRIQQSLLGCKKNGMMVTTATASLPSTMCYPSSRPESDFTLDLPRAEQLRVKMEKEKKFRQRCRIITTFLSLVFFLLTVMVVSLVLTRGKRMFGSMI